MRKEFNVSADCKPDNHYMVDISGQLGEIKEMIDAGKYFTINRARQYGKTTMLKALERSLRNEYQVIRLDFQLLGYASFETEQMFAEAFSNELLTYVYDLPEEIRAKLDILANGNPKKCTLQNLFRILCSWCRISEKKIVLMIDEVDSATNNQVFLDFLAQLRGYYINRDMIPTFHSVILAGVYDVKNIKRKIRPDDERKMNSPKLSQGLYFWNIAADFNVVMSFSKEGIAGMLHDYEEDYLTGMNVSEIAGLLYDYTSGYPFLVSRICKLIDERVVGGERFPDKASAWTGQGFLEAVKMLLSERNTLFESLAGKLENYPELRQTLYSLLFGGKTVVYNMLDEATNITLM